MKIKLFITGGTIDDIEYDKVENAPKNHQTLIPSLLQLAKATIDLDIETLFAKDSKFITDSDLELIAKKSIECEENNIVITHGTMTMSETAKYLGKKDIPKTVVLLGAMVPANKADSDAMFNLGAALTAVQILPKGVYITMNGKVFSWVNVRKNFEKGIFENQ